MYVNDLGLTIIFTSVPYYGVWGQNTCFLEIDICELNFRTLTDLKHN